MPQILPIRPLTTEAFAPFGQVIEISPAKMRLINGGTTERHHGLGRAEALGEGAEVIFNIFRGQPRRLPYSVDMMERHPFGSQSFQPLSGGDWLVVVAADEGGKPGVPQVFLARGDQGVNYPAGLWHHPLMALGDVCDFLVVDRQGPGVNLEEYFYQTPFTISEIS
ncbi:ureidoglycolate lyase [Rhizobium sp. TRM95796]|uniref:ureidoglycolate lyase n=1 Tax=Rhizobium sp. TRM95796 TaxID=2979862 RepID=UPI0021E8B7FA|nr:ureidoglycolate lyase [Rhizobium sp. TRM95796]MCV3766705.1 ureidoglycolate lyase [Rhizobium sp. TRM95796]